MTRRYRRWKLPSRDAVVEKVRYNQRLWWHYRRDTTPNVPDEFKDLVRHELVNAHVGALDCIGWFVVEDAVPPVGLLDDTVKERNGDKW